MSGIQLPITLFHAKTTSFVPENGTSLQRQCRLSIELSFSSMQASKVIGALPPLNGGESINTVGGIRNPGVH